MKAAVIANAILVAGVFVISIITTHRINRLEESLQILKTEVIDLKAEVKELNQIVGNKRE